jgi:putative PIN family toxin of toxin-antitoxin system
LLRVVLDTNVIVSAVISKGKARELLNRGIENRFQIVTSEFVLKEVRKVLHRPKFKTSDDEINNIILTMIQSSDVATVASNFNVVQRDPADDMILTTAFDGGADVIVTGDRHLLDLKRFRKSKIVSVSEALKELRVF